MARNNCSRRRLVSSASRKSLRRKPSARAPATRFNRAITANRVYAHTTLSLSSMREVSHAFGCSLNDVYIALVGGALRSYLAGLGELSAEALTAAVPVSVRGEQDEPAFGNALAYWFVTTASHLEDPVERLRAVSASTRAQS